MRAGGVPSVAGSVYDFEEVGGGGGGGNCGL